MGDAEQPPGSVPVDDEVTARASASPEPAVVPADADPNADPNADPTVDPNASTMEEAGAPGELPSAEAAAPAPPVGGTPEPEPAGVADASEPTADAQHHGGLPTLLHAYPSVPHAGEPTAVLSGDDSVTHVLPRVAPVSNAIEDGPRDSGWASARPPDAVDEPAAPEPEPEEPPATQTAAEPEAAEPEPAEPEPAEPEPAEPEAAEPEAAEPEAAEPEAAEPEPAEPEASVAEGSAFSDELPSAHEVIQPPPPEPGSLAATLMGAEVGQDTEPVQPDVDPIPPPGMHLRSKPPPKPAGYVSERPQASAVPQSVVPPAAASSSRPAPALDTDVAFSNRLRKSKLPAVLWVLSLGVAGFVGWSVAGAVNEKKLVAAAASASAAVQTAREAAIAETKAAIPPPPAYLDLTQPPGVRSIIEVIKTEPGKRTRIEALALGRQWQEKRFEDYARFSAELRRSPQKLDDPKSRAQALEFVHDRSTSRPMLELLSELPSSRALDILYEVWIGSKDRNETTQLAEALLLAKDVRKRASGALELALALRDKPTDCGELQKLVEVAIREGDRRSSNQLVTTAARQNCGPSGDKDCVQCLTDPKDMRKAIRATAAKPEPVP